MHLNEILDLYSLHSNPSSLKGYDVAYDQVPDLAWKKYFVDGFCMSNPETERQEWRTELKKRERLWATDPQLASYYAIYIIKGRFPEAEKTIASHPNWAYYYAREVIKGRFPEGEKVIASDPQSAYHYAQYIIKGRWPEAEKVIASDPFRAYYYARDIIKGRFPEAEKVIANDPEWKRQYEQKFGVKLQ